jgi:hypothetical protein
VFSSDRPFTPLKGRVDDDGLLSHSGCEKLLGWVGKTPPTTQMAKKKRSVRSGLEKLRQQHAWRRKKEALSL